MRDNKPDDNQLDNFTRAVKTVVNVPKSAVGKKGKEADVEAEVIVGGVYEQGGSWYMYFGVKDGNYLTSPPLPDRQTAEDRLSAEFEETQRQFGDDPVCFERIDH